VQQSVATDQLVTERPVESMTEADKMAIEEVGSFS
jgi:hypothetical protein